MRYNHGMILKEPELDYYHESQTLENFSDKAIFRITNGLIRGKLTQ
jgi:hypothetical protein